jgi:CrcB protein
VVSDAPPTPTPAAPGVARASVVLAVFLGGALGTLGRAGLAEALPHDDGSAWPWATFAVNLLGALLLGWWSTRLAGAPHADPRARPFLATGVCGGLTTFSTLQVELVGMGRADAWGTAAGYAVASIVLGLLAVVAGRAAARRVGR